MSAGIQRWKLFAGFVSLAIALLLLIAVAVASFFGRGDLNCPTAFVLSLTVALTVAMGLGFLDGYAKIGGAVPLPSALKTPVTIAATGGVATLVIVMICMYYLFAKPICDHEDRCAGRPPPRLNLQVCSPLITDAGRLTFVLEPIVADVCPLYTVWIEIAADAEFTQLLQSPLEFRPAASTKVAVDASMPAGRVGFVRIVVRDDQREVKASEPCRFDVPAP